MLNRAELETALAKAEADIGDASVCLNRAQAELAKANAAWKQVLEDRRKGDSDRRKPDSVWDGAFADRRKAEGDRRKFNTGLATLAREVSDRDSAYKARSKAEADCTNAETRLNDAIVRRDQAAKRLNTLDNA